MGVPFLALIRRRWGEGWLRPPPKGTNGGSSERGVAQGGTSRPAASEGDSPVGVSPRPVGPQRTEPQRMPIEQLVPRSQSLALRGGRALSARMTHITGKPPNRASGDCTRTEDFNSLARIYLRIYLRLPLAPLGPRFAALCAHTCGRHLAGPNLETILCTCTKIFMPPASTVWADTPPVNRDQHKTWDVYTNINQETCMPAASVDGVGSHSKTNEHL